MQQNTLKIYNIEDTHLQDAPLLKEYYSHFLNGEYDMAFEILKTTPRLITRVLTQDNINLLIKAIVSMEQMYFDKENEIKEYVNLLQLNIDELIFLRDWQPDSTYSKFNFVLENGELYFAIGDSIDVGVKPSENKTDWLYLGLKGEKGDIGTGMYFAGVWNEEREYNRYEVVVYGGNILYVSLEDGNLNKAPSASTTFWNKIFEIRPAQYLLSSEVPPLGAVESGKVWLYIVDDNA